MRDFAVANGFTEVRLIGRGLEFLVFRASAPDGSQVVLRTPAGPRFQSNDNDPRVDTRALLRWEYAVTSHLARLGFPVAVPHELAVGEPDVLVAEHVPDDGRGADQHRLGALLRRLHELPVPPVPPVAGEGMTPHQLLPRRIERRWRALTALVPDLPAAPHPDQLAAVLADRPAATLIHLDVRAANLRCVDGDIRGLLDWSNALIAEPALELARLAEFARLPGNGLDLDAVLAGYGEPGPPDTPASWIYRLDAAVMLAVVFLSEAPDQNLGPGAVDRLREVSARLARELAR